MSAKKVIEQIKKHSNFLITAHVDLEGDALGSELALASLLRKLGKEVRIVNASPTPANYKFLPGVQNIVLNNKGKFQSQAKTQAQATFIIDCSDRERVGRVADLIGKQMPVINIDHHLDNTNFGCLNWVEPQASCTGEMIYRLFRETAIPLARKDAINIYTAILTDTGSFRHCNTSSTSFRIVGELLKTGINPAKIYMQIYESNSFRDMSLAAKIISRMCFGATNSIAWAKINKQEYRVLKGKPEVLGRILDFAYAINTVKVVLIFNQLDNGLIKLSLRSKKPISVQKIASFFGGGGHKYASGCTIKGSLKEVEQKVLSKVKQALNK